MPESITLSPRDRIRFDKLIMHKDVEACWKWTGNCSKAGYGRFGVQGRNIYAHRIAWMIENGPIPDGLHILHCCDNPPCANPQHLFLGTHQDNMADRDRKGRRTPLRGTGHPHARLTETDVREIRSLSDSGWTYRAIADVFDIDFTHVGNIVRRKAWKHVDNVEGMTP